MAVIGPHETSRWAADLAAFVGVSEQPTWNWKSVQLIYKDPAILAGIETNLAVHSTQELLGPDKTLSDKLDVCSDILSPSPASDAP